MTTINQQIPKLHTRAAFVPATLNEDERTVEVTWTTGSQVRRFDWWTEKEWIEEQALKMSKEIGTKITTSAWMRMTLLKDMEK